MSDLRIQIPQEICISPQQVFGFIDNEAHKRLEKLLKVSCDGFDIDVNGDIECYTDHGHHRGGEERKTIWADGEMLKEAVSIIEAIETLRKLILS